TRLSPLAKTSAASLRPITTTPSSSGTTASPGFTLIPAQPTDTFTAPNVAFTVPLAEIAFDHTGKPISRNALASRTPASITSPLTPRAISEVDSRSPTMPSAVSLLQQTP